MRRLICGLRAFLLGQSGLLRRASGVAQCLRGVRSDYGVLVPERDRQRSDRFGRKRHVHTSKRFSRRLPYPWLGALNAAISAGVAGVPIWPSARTDEKPVSSTPPNVPISVGIVCGQSGHSRPIVATAEWRTKLSLLSAIARANGSQASAPAD